MRSLLHSDGNDRLCLCGNLDGGLLVGGTPDDVARARDAARERSGAGGAWRAHPVAGSCLVLL